MKSASKLTLKGSKSEELNFMLLQVHMWTANRISLVFDVLLLTNSWFGLRKAWLKKYNTIKIVLKLQSHPNRKHVLL